jgi:hypothetical protein
MMEPLDQQLWNTGRGTGFLAEFDFEQGGAISLNRNSLEVDKVQEVAAICSQIVSDAQALMLSELDWSAYMDLSPRWAATRRLDGNEHPPYWAFSQSFGGEDGIPDSWYWREVHFPAVLRPELIAHYAPIWDAATLNSVGIADELRPIDRGYDSPWPLVGIKATRIIFDSNTSFNVNILYQSDAELSSLPLNALFPAQWEHVLGIVIDSLIVFNTNHVVFRKITADAWREYNKVAANKKGVDLVTAIAGSDSASAACFLAANVGTVGEFWNALRDNCPDELKRIFVLVGLDSSEASFKVWRTGYDGGVRSISIRGADFSKGYMGNLGKGLLPLPTEAEWFIKTGRRS